MSTTANVGKAEVTLLPDSRVTVYKDHTTLQKGTTTVRGASHALEAGTLRVVPAVAHSLIEVGYSDRKVVTISAHAGGADVFTTSGELLASLNPGGVLAFEPSSGSGTNSSALGQASANTALQLHGTLTFTGGKYFVTMGGKIYQITSSSFNLANYVGKIIDAEVSIVNVEGNVTVVTASVVTVVSQSGHVSGVIVGVAIGVAVAATIGGLAAAGTFSSGPSSSTP
jgi:hypothetical protein